VAREKRETLEQAGYLNEYEDREDGEIVLTDRETGSREIWFRNDGHASYGIVVDGHDYEFARSIPYNLSAVNRS